MTRSPCTSSNASNAETDAKRAVHRYLVGELAPFVAGAATVRGGSVAAAGERRGSPERTRLAGRPDWHAAAVTSTTWHLAQVNIGRLQAPIDHPEIAEFKAALDTINALAEASPGFVWRLKDEGGNATSIEVDPGDELVIPNMSVWESVDALSEFVYRSDHTPFLRRRRE